MPNLLLEQLKKRSEFSTVARVGQRWITSAFVIQIYQRSCEGNIRYGITASRKVGGAVARNRAKRRLRALIRPILLSYGRPGTEYVFIAREEVLRRNFALMEQDLKTLLRKISQQEKTIIS